MSHVALQRVLVRMLYDPDFVRRVYDDAEAATADCDLSADERDWLTAVDARAYGVDPFRRSRSLAGLLEEFPVAAGRKVRAENDPKALDLFFSSAVFHSGMQRGESLAALFAAWLEEGADPATADFARLAGRMAAARRAREAAAAPVPVAGEIALADGVDFLPLPAGRMQQYAAQYEALRAGPGSVVENVVDLNVALPEVEALGDETEWLMIDGHESNLRLEPVSPELAQVLTLCREPIRFGDFVQRAAEFGAERSDCEEIVASFAEDGVLRVGTSGAR